VPRSAQLGLSFITTLLLLGCCRVEGSEGGLTLAGSTSVQPFAEMLAEEYMRKHPGSPPINVQGGGSSAGIQAAETGTADIGMSSRNLKDKELALGLKPIAIAKDAIAIIVNPSNPVCELSLEQVRRIFTGEIINWREVGGKDAPIVLITREEGSGTRGAFEEMVMKGSPISLRALRQDSNGAVRVIVASDPNAIGYISLGIVNEQVKALRLDGVEASVGSVKRGEYSLVRPFLFVIKGEPKGLAKDFIEFVLSPEAQELLAKEGLVGID